MPTLDWIGKNAVVGHHKEVPYRLIKCDKELSAGAAGEGNLLVEGDNLHALKALLPYYGGKVKCIYIDPPYNTGNEGWIYNDNVTSPEIKKWLGQVVGREAEDLSRHDKWLCMMYPRLVLLHQFLREDGAIFISIDDNEIGQLRLLMDEIFGMNNFVTCISWHKRVSPANDAKYFSTDLDYVLVYARKLESWKPNRLKMNEVQRGNYRNPDSDPRGDWNSAAYTCAKTAEERPNLYYAIRQPNTGAEIWPNKNRVWAYERTTHAEHVAENMIYWGSNGLSEKPRIKKFLNEARLVVPRSFWTPNEAGHNQEGKLELIDLNITEFFATPKPSRLVKRVLEIATNPGDLVLDSFAGSGTTGHAVLNMNKDGGKRRFILVEMESKIARNITAERVHRITHGYTNANGEKIEGLGGGFRFCTLSEPLFDERGQINSSVKFSDLAHHVFFTETGEPMPKRPDKRTPLLGVHNGRAIYLLFNGILGDKQAQGGNVLTNDVLKILPSHAGARVIYGTACRLSANRLKREGVTFRQIPYEIKTN
jgi:adenine-specific DNA-methyltransferase